MQANIAPKNINFSQIKIIKKPLVLPSELLHPGLKNHLQKSVFHHRFVMTFRRCEIEKYEKKHEDFQCVHLMDLQNTCLEKSSKNSSTSDAIDRFLKRPQIENINISKDVCKIHPPKKENGHFQRGLQTPLEPPWGPPRPLWTEAQMDPNGS